MACIPEFNMKVDENGGNDHQLKQLFVFKKISLSAPWEMYKEE